MLAKSWFLILVPILAVVALLLLAMDGESTQDTVTVTLAERTNVSPVQQTRGCTFSHHGSNPLRVAIAGVLSSDKTLEDYRELLTYMGQKLDRQVSFTLKSNLR